MWIKNQQINKPKETTSIRGRDTCRTRRHQSPKQPRSQGPLSSYLEKLNYYFLEVGIERTLGTRLSPKITHFIELASTILFSKGCYLLTLTGSFYFSSDFPALAWSDRFSETSICQFTYMDKNLKKLAYMIR